MNAKLKAWFFLFRPWSYVATLVPFLVAAGFVTGLGGAPRAHWLHWLGGIGVGLLFQSTVNLLNTWGDERSGVDSVPGAIRTTPQVHDGLVSMRALGIAAAACACAAAVLGVLLCFHREEYSREFLVLSNGCAVNVPLLVAGFVGFLGATNYSTGVKFKYHGLGVPFVSFLMGPLEIFVAVALLKPSWVNDVVWPFISGSAHDVSPMAALVALGVCAFATLPVAALVGVIMHGNDMRDIPTDRAAGIVTLASWLGPRRALCYYRLCHVLPYVVCGVLLALLFFFDRGRGLSFALPFLALPLSARTVCAAARTYRENPESPPWRGFERASGKVHLVFGLLYALAWLWA